MISIHALLAESDYPAAACRPRAAISIHALLAESDPSWATRARAAQQFLSTLSLRRATRDIYAVCFAGLDFYPRSPCGERRQAASGSGRAARFLSTLSLRRATGIYMRCVLPVLISIHALLAESDNLIGGWYQNRKEFLSTLSLRRATSTTLTFPGFGVFLSTLSLRRATI